VPRISELYGISQDVTSMARMTQVEHVGGLVLRLTFDDGLVRELDFTEILEAPLFEALRDPSYFAKVTIDATAGPSPGPTESTSTQTFFTVTTSRQLVPGRG
jgi:hypothetical protein